MKKLFLAAMMAAVLAGVGVNAVSAAETAGNPQQAWTDFDAKMQSIMSQMYQKRAELAALYNAEGTVDQAKVQSLYREMADLQAQAFAARQEFSQSAGDGYGPRFGGRGMGGRGFGGRGGPGAGYGNRGGWGCGGWGGGRGGCGGCW